jgi:trans-AT polyketide synthase, acyltransferase and oxidoreductase domains
MPFVTLENLGDNGFKKAYGIKYPYLVGAMYKGVSSKELVICLAKAGLCGFYGTGGLQPSMIEEVIKMIQSQLEPSQAYGMNLLHTPDFPDLEEMVVKLLIEHHIKFVEAAAFMQITPGLIWYRLNGVSVNKYEEIDIPHRVLAKVSRPEIAEMFMSPPPQEIVDKLLDAGKISSEEAKLSQYIPVADDVCVESDSGGHTDQGVAFVLLPAIKQLSKIMQKKYDYATPIYVGAAGGIGTPEAAAAAFMLGADFVLTGSINQCTVEAATSDSVKNILESVTIQDMTYAPAGDMFEIGAKVQVIGKGLFFPARARKLYDLYKQYNSWEDIDVSTREQIQRRYFQKDFDIIWEETKNYYLRVKKPEIVDGAEQNPKRKMALVFRWYFVYSARLALKGHLDQVINYQIQSGPAIGAFNQWVKNTPLEKWQNRHVDEIADKLILGTVDLLNQRYKQWSLGVKSKLF